ncbi:glycosyltransferase family 25 protein [Marinimicrobium alkaliphilum]|uniref:glycosyltransferase family 25 protein n=1 Tax=Marinimicrobium alkaliphilum TaxID=2202654 RepID=UPI000DB990EC|nr:glycosyltransferase family 25 protein [Marinimicrobium alkaliphilum]
MTDSQLPLYVINLPRSTERRAFMQEQAAALGVALEMFEAVDGRAAHPLFERVDRARRLRCKGRPFSAGELGVWASHTLLWQRCVALGHPIIVLEDDAVIGPAFAVFLTQARAVAEQVDYVRLYQADKPSRLRKTVAGYAIHEYRKTPFGAVAYLLTPEAAQRFLYHAHPWVLPVDDYMDLSWRHGVPMLGIKPGVVGLEQPFETTIHPPQKARTPLAYKVTREFFRLYLGFRRLIGKIIRI